MLDVALVSAIKAVLFQWLASFDSCVAWVQPLGGGGGRMLGGRKLRENNTILREVVSPFSCLHGAFLLHALFLPDDNYATPVSTTLMLVVIIKDNIGNITRLQTIHLFQPSSLIIRVVFHNENTNIRSNSARSPSKSMEPVSARLLLLIS